MNTLVFLTAFSLNSFCLLAQEDRTHNGFHLSLGYGPPWGTSNRHNNQGSAAKINGTGAEIDVQIGLFVEKNLILHGPSSAKPL